jgi:hypothetical protein
VPLHCLHTSHWATVPTAERPRLLLGVNGNAGIGHSPELTSCKTLEQPNHLTVCNHAEKAAIVFWRG